MKEIEILKTLKLLAKDNRILIDYLDDKIDTLKIMERKRREQFERIQLPYITAILQALSIKPMSVLELQEYNYILANLTASKMYVILYTLMDFDEVERFTVGDIVKFRKKK